MAKHSTKRPARKIQSVAFAIGADLGDRFSHVWTLDSDGVRCKEERVRTSPARKRRSQPTIEPAKMGIRVGGLALGISVAVVMLEGCGTSQTAVAGAMTQGAVLPTAASLVQRSESARGHIQHVVIVIQENRSFENFFAGFPGANAPMYGYALHGRERVKVALHETTFETNPNLPHTWESALRGWDNGKMDGFHTGPRTNYAAYAYVDRFEVAPIGQWPNDTCSPTPCFLANSAAATSPT